MALTKREIDQLNCENRGGKRFRVADDYGLYIEVMPSSSKFWRHRSQGGNSKWVTLGEYPYMSIQKAREKNLLIKRKIQSGELEQEIHKQQKMTFREIAEEWLEKKEGKSRAITEKNKQVARKRLEKNVFDVIGNKTPDDVTPMELLSLLRRIEASGHTETARRVLFLMSNVFRYAFAIGEGVGDPTSALRGALITKPVRHFASIKDPQRIGFLMRAIDAYPYAVVRLAMKLQAYTFVRPGELRMAEWKEFDLHSSSEWRIPEGRMKMKIQHIVPLSRQAVEVIKEMRPLTGHGRYVFPSSRAPAGDRPMSDATVTVALRTMGFSAEEMTGHGFRSMASTLLNEHGWNRDAIERQLAHQERDPVRAAYNYAEYLPERRRMMQWWADYLDGLRNDRNTSEK